MKLKVKTSMSVLKSIAGCDPPDLAFFYHCPGLGLAASPFRVPGGDHGTWYLVSSSAFPIIGHLIEHVCNFTYSPTLSRQPTSANGLSPMKPLPAKVYTELMDL